MDYAFLHQRDESIHDISQDRSCRLFWYGTVGRHVFLEVIVAQFLDYVVVVGTLHYFVEGYNVGRFDLLQDFNLLKQSSLQVFVGVDFVSTYLLILRFTTLTAQAILVLSCYPLYT